MGGPHALPRSNACAMRRRPARGRLCRRRAEAARRSSGHPLAASGRCWHVLSRRPARFFASEAAGRRPAAGRAVIVCACTRSSRCLRVIARPMSKVSGRLYAASFARSRSPHAPDPALSGSCSTGATSMKAGQQTSSRRTVGCSRPIRHQHAFVRWSPRSRPASRNRRTRPAARARSVRRGTIRTEIPPRLRSFDCASVRDRYLSARRHCRARA